MSRPFLFLAGEFRVSMPTVFEREHWQHTMSPSRLAMTDGRLHRESHPGEELRGVVHYANCEDDERERQNLRLIRDNGIPCWPDPTALLLMLDRHEVLRRCLDYGVGSQDRRQFVEPGAAIDLPYPFVMKTGNQHRGEGKHLVRSADELLPVWSGIATVEPFFEGVSVRVLVIGNRHWVVRYDNPDSWIKNSVGAEVSPWGFSYPAEVIDEAEMLTREFGLDVSGCDYVVDRDDRWHFLEFNTYPGLDVFDDEVEHAKAFLRSRMDLVEKAAEERWR